MAPTAPCLKQVDRSMGNDLLSHSFSSKDIEKKRLCCSTVKCATQGGSSHAGLLAAN